MAIFLVMLGSGGALPPGLLFSSWTLATWFSHGTGKPLVPSPGLGSSMREIDQFLSVLPQIVQGLEECRLANILKPTEQRDIAVS